MPESQDTSPSRVIFSTLDQLYRYLEVRALEYKYIHQLADLFQVLRDRLAEQGDTPGQTKCQWEVDFFNFVIRDNELHPHFAGTTAEGRAFQYPTLDAFTKETFVYLRARLHSTSNPLLRARYGHLLWLTKRDAVAARLAVDAYYQLLHHYQARDRREPDGHFGLDVLTTAKALYPISAQIGYQRPDAARAIQGLIRRFNPRSSSMLAVRGQLLSLVLEKGKGLRAEELAGLEGSVWRLTSRLRKARNHHAVIQFAGFGDRLREKVRGPKRNWQERIAAAYESLMREAEGNVNLASLHFCQLAIEYYKRARHQRKVKELERAHATLRSSQRFATIKTPVDLTAQVERYRKVAADLAKKSPREILILLMADRDLLPRRSKMEDLAKEQAKTFVVQHLFPVAIVDQEGNTAEHFSTDEEKLYHSILQNYGWEIGFSRAILLEAIITAAHRSRRLSLSLVLDFLREQSWLGSVLTKRLPNNVEVSYSWIASLAPALAEYFAELGRAETVPTYLPAYALVIDSLAIKIEGIVRDMCRIGGGVTSYTTTDHAGRPIAREKDLGALLREPQVAGVLDDDDLLFLKYLLVEKAGLNLRHRVAHALLSAPEYSAPLAHLLFLAVLRLGRYAVEHHEVTIRNVASDESARS